MKDFKTEAEAQSLWCPLGRMATELSECVVAVNRDPFIGCVGSNCMMWRWSHQDTGVNDPPTGFCGAAVSPKYI